MAEQTAEPILAKWAELYKLPNAHVEYFRKEVEDVLENGNEEKRKIDLESIEKNAKDSDYHLMKKIGSGAFGHVFQGLERKTNRVVAIKVIDLEETKDDIMTINREINALTQGKLCQQLTQYYGSCVFGTKLWIIMEYMDGGSVLDRVKKKALEEKHIAVIVREVLSGLKYLFNDKKIHRDIKSANILLSRNGQVKLADFGASAQLTDTMTKCNTFVGSPYWMAPEVMANNSYDGKADIWSLGITCLEMALGKPPHSIVHPLKVINLIVSEPPPKLEGDQYSKEFKNFVSVCLLKDPTKRPDIPLLFSHPFVQKAGSLDLIKELFADEPQS